MPRKCLVMLPILHHLHMLLSLHTIQVTKPDGELQFPPGFDMDNLRRIQYTFPQEFVDYPAVGTTYVNALCLQVNLDLLS